MIEKILALIFVPFLITMVYAQTKYEKATFAGGCFWCMQPVFHRMNGVVSVVAGYTGGSKAAPTYEEVSSGSTGHREAVEVTYDPAKVAYKDLLEVFWENIDPTDAAGQFADKGSQYRTAIFYHDDEQKRIAQESREELSHSGLFKRPVVTEIVPASRFYPAEEYHQDYALKNPVQYNMYRTGSGREGFLKKIWGDRSAKKAPPGESEKPEDQELKKRLTPMQYEVTQQCGTEPPFNNEYWDNHRDGIYVDRISGEALFSSRDKFDSGTGWPSFTKPVEPGHVVETKDNSHGMVRTEIKSKDALSHLGHIFEDGPKPTGLRYCVNSASLRFIAKEDLEREGYGKYRKLFDIK